MGEQAKKIGDKLEGFGEKIYERFNWEELTRDQEIKCTKSSHRTEKGNPKKTHGIDLYHKCLDPYKNQYISIITECKNYKWEAINQKSIQTWFEQLEWTMECAQNAEELLEYNKNVMYIKTGYYLFMRMMGTMMILRLENT
ncbi:hypothetical protein [Aminipila terrae]|uniref:GAPS4 PD-(D/E)XK nuclease domain-containing protein n=1 Tax=Aminipila terrae TaxID=2697030 RepID=A0A6P1MGA1_9FIRM|nr:hypothetical protein [Aminipila terrae]QHI73082.1 hypothetical protein Ami3637_12330 [Aminipila terrae]